jgi:hypothetical protein
MSPNSAVRTQSLTKHLFCRGNASPVRFEVEFRWRWIIILGLLLGFALANTAPGQTDEMGPGKELDRIVELVKQGRLADAVSVAQKFVSVCERTFGPEHPSTITGLKLLAWVYQQQGRYTQAEPLLRRALVVEEKALGPEHRDIAGTLMSLALLNFSQGHYSECIGPDELDSAVGVSKYIESRSSREV